MGRTLNLLDQLIPLRFVVSTTIVLGGIVVSGLKMEWYIASWFHDLSHRLTQIENVQSMQGIDLRSHGTDLEKIKALIAETKPARDAQIKQLDIKLDNLTITVQDQHDDTAAALNRAAAEQNTESERISNVEKDVSRLNAKILGVPKSPGGVPK